MIILQENLGEQLIISEQLRCSEHGIPSLYFPIVFHNFLGHDEHFIPKCFKKNFAKDSINCIPNNMEKYLSFRMDLRFIDFLQFMNVSLEKLSSNLPFDEFINTRRHSSRDAVHLLL